MEKNINITNTKENILEMDIEIEGIKATDKKCFFVIKTKEVDFSFKCNNPSGNKWTVTIPKMPQIENTLYDFYIYMVVDGYYFQPYNGTINVIKSSEVYVKDISNKTFKPTEKKSEKKEYEIVKPKGKPADTVKPEEIKKKPVEETKKVVKKKPLIETKFDKNSITAITNRILKESAPKTEAELLKEQKIKDILAESNIFEKATIKFKKGKVTEI